MDCWFFFGISGKSSNHSHVFNVTEVNTKESLGEIPEGLPGSENMACMERSIRNLGDPVVKG